MLKSFKNILVGKKSDCCTISIQEVDKNEANSKEEKRKCCEVKIENSDSKENN
ncbi:hypothetical protein [Neobacillus sp. LXY-4]|uniref:hypothetical protein n=1 Tax=Neobacillus sp. LXY-4 TaxID=3379826 RepID=UPI003EE1B618